MRILVVASLLLAGLLSGCATTNPIKSANIDNTKPLAPENGVVALQVINNVDRLAPLHKGWTEVIAVRVDNREALKQAAIEKAKAEAKAKGKTFNEEDVDWDIEAYSFTPVYQGTVDSQLFIGNMPEGEYVIASLYSYFNDGNMMSWISMPVFYSAGKFDVKPTTLTDLGSIVFQPLLSIKESSFWSNQSSSKAFVTRSYQQQPLGQFVISHYPLIEQQIGDKATLGWIEDELESFRKSLSELATQNAFAATPIVLPKSGIRAIAAKFGMLNVLRDDKWQSVNLPTNSQLYAAAELGDTVIVGSELGQLFVTKDWQQWQLIKPVAANEAIVWFGQNDTYTYALTSSAKQYTMYQLTSVDGAWKEVGNFIKKNPNDWLVQNGGLFAFITKQGVLRVINDNKRYDFTEADSSWSMDKSDSLRSLAQLADGTLLGVEVSQWDGVGSQVISTDDGLNWKAVSRRMGFSDNKADTSMPAITDEGRVVTLGRIKKSVDGKSDMMIISSPLDGISSSKYFKNHANAKDDCQTLLPQLTKGNRIYLLCDQGQILSTDDFGKTYTTEIDRDVAKMQEEFDVLMEKIKAQQEAKEAEEKAASQSE